MERRGMRGALGNVSSLTHVHRLLPEGQGATVTFPSAAAPPTAPISLRATSGPQTAPKPEVTQVMRLCPLCPPSPLSPFRLLSTWHLRSHCLECQPSKPWA